jgi:hypothetical protein
MTGQNWKRRRRTSAAAISARRSSRSISRASFARTAATPLEGWYCHSCGQNADTHHRSILHLLWEAIEGMFHLDGRLANTLPLLFFKPGKLAKDYMEGRIVRHVPPFRTFLVALLLFIFAAEHAIHGIRHQQELKEEKEATALTTPQGRKAKADEDPQGRHRDSRRAPQGPAAGRDEDLKEEGADKAKIAAGVRRGRQEGAGPLRQEHGRGRRAGEESQRRRRGPGQAARPQPGGRRADP